MRCIVCSSPDAFKENIVSYCDKECEEPFVVENVPAFVCVFCGDMAVPAGALAVIKSFREGVGKPIRTVQVPVFDYNDLTD